MRSHRDLIVKLAARHKLPAVYFDRVFVDAGGLISYGPDIVDQYRRAAATSTASSRARSPPTCRSRRRQVRTRHQPQDRQGARPQVPPRCSCRADEVIE